MIGAKQFLMKHKKPILKADKTFAEMMLKPRNNSKDEAAFKNIGGSFLDKFKAPQIKEEPRKYSLPRKVEVKKKITPPVKIEKLEVEKADKPIDLFPLALLDFLTPKFGPCSHEIEIEKMPEKKEEISDEAIEQISYRVFENLRHYLTAEAQMNNNSNKRVKIEVDIC